MNRNRRLRQQVYQSRRWRRLRFMALRRDGFNCLYCGGPAQAVHHKEAIEKTGIESPKVWDLKNLESICRKCHREIGDANHNKRQPNEQEQAWRDFRKERQNEKVS